MYINMNILVTGGAGYVGYSAVKSLARKYPDSKIIILDNLSKSKLENVLEGRNDSIFSKNGMDGVVGYNQALQDIISELENN